MIDFDGPEPLYQQAADVLRDRIRSGTYAPRRRLPSLDALADELDLARNTVKRAVKILADEGYVYGVHGKGTFVAAKSPPPRDEAGA